MFPGVYHILDGRERQNTAVTNAYTRRAVNELHALGQILVTDPQMMPHMAFQPPPMDADTLAQNSGLTTANVPESRFPRSIADMHYTQQAVMRRC